jgi:hypothetical protein
MYVYACACVCTEQQSKEVLLLEYHSHAQSSHLTVSSMDHLEHLPPRELRISSSLLSLARGLDNSGGNGSPIENSTPALSYHTPDRSSGTVTRPCIAGLHPASSALGRFNLCTIQ